MLSVEHVTKRYGTFTALEDISLTFTPGVYGLLAPNGAGKTTLIKMLTTLLFPTQGQIPWNGEDIHALGEEYGACWAICPSSLAITPATPPGSFSAMGPPSRAFPPRRPRGALTSSCSWWACLRWRTKSSASFPAACSSARALPWPCSTTPSC